MSEKDLPTQQSQEGKKARVPSPHVDTRRTSHLEGQEAEGPPSAQRVIWRVDRQSTFKQFKQGRRSRAGPVTVSFVCGRSDEPPRVAFAIGRRVGSAVVRNKLKRQLRTLIRQQAPNLRPGAYLVGVSPAGASLSFDLLREAVTKALSDFTKTETLL